MRCLDPATLTESERFAEIAKILARGIQRHLAAEIKSAAGARNSRDQLDQAADGEASCGSNAMNSKNQQPAA